VLKPLEHVFKWWCVVRTRSRWDLGVSVGDARMWGGGEQLEDDRRLVDEVTYKMLETVLPKTGGRVMIVGGKSELRGLRGTLLHKNKDTEQVMRLQVVARNPCFYRARGAEWRSPAGVPGRVPQQ